MLRNLLPPDPQRVAAARARIQAVRNASIGVGTTVRVGLRRGTVTGWTRDETGRFLAAVQMDAGGVEQHTTDELVKAAIQ